MHFEITPILDKMAALYQLPRNRKRFEQYLLMLQGNSKDDMILPIAGYNPMGNGHVLAKLEELRAIKAEEIIREALNKINTTLKSKEKRKIEVVINLADDVGGAWSNFYSTDFSNKFDIHALVNRNFCTPYFYTGESYTTDLIRQRCTEYVYRTLYWIKNKQRLKTLEEHVEQELFVQQHIERNVVEKDFSAIESFYEENKASDDYNLIFNFFYGDEASEVLGYKTYGRQSNEGFEYIKHLVAKG